jgi:hypothetical protein
LTALVAVFVVISIPRVVVEWVGNSAGLTGPMWELFLSYRAVGVLAGAVFLLVRPPT